MVVVGGGVSGLAAAWYLTRQRSVRVTVLEATGRLGGALRGAEVAGVRIDVGAESVLARRPEALDLIGEVGLGGEVVHPAAGTASVLSRGRLHPVPAGTLLGVPGDPGATRGPLTDAEVQRVGAEAPVPLEADDVSVGDLVAARLGDAVVDRLVEPLLGGVYAGHSRDISCAATAPALLAAARRGESLVQAVRRTVPARPPDAPTPPVFAGLPGGLHRLPEVLGRRLLAAGAEVVLGCTVREVRARPGGGWLVVTGAVPSPTTYRADAVVLATPPAPTARLLRDVAPGSATALAGVETASVAIVTLALPDPDGAGSALPGPGVLVPPVEGLATKAATFSAGKWGWVGDAGRANGVLLLRASLGRHREEAVLQREDADLVRQVRADLARALGRELPAPVDAHVQRWGGGLPQYAVGHLERVARVRAGLPTGLAVCGATYDGVGVPACVAAARAAAERVLQGLGAAP